MGKKNFSEEQIAFATGETLAKVPLTIRSGNIRRGSKPLIIQQEPSPILRAAQLPEYPCPADVYRKSHLSACEWPVG